MSIVTSLKSRRSIAVGLTATAAAAAVALGTAVPAHADIDRNGRYGAGSYEFSVDREGRGYEMSFDLDGVKPGSKWVVALRHEGKLVVRKTLTAHRDDDGKGELDIERWVKNTAGKDTFSVRFREAGTNVYKYARIDVR